MTFSVTVLEYCFDSVTDELLRYFEPMYVRKQKLCPKTVIGLYNKMIENI